VSYLTIELHGSIPESLRPLIGNRIYGCDDCQIICPWNRFAKLTAEKDFNPRHQLNSQQLITVFAWSEAEFLAKTEGSAIRRIGYERWLRNIAVALGNAPSSPLIIAALKTKHDHHSTLVKEHVLWALTQQLKSQ
jgi:epoxyqueuosine reductase